jgi:hypothetical protein
MKERKENLIHTIRLGLYYLSLIWLRSHAGQPFDQGISRDQYEYVYAEYEYIGNKYFP